MALLILVLLSFFILSLESVQTRLGKYATGILNKDFGTSLRVEKVKIKLFPLGDVDLKGVLEIDSHKDTLFYIQSLSTSILEIDKLINEGHPYLDNVDIDGLYLNMKQYKGEKKTNLEDFIDAFDDGSPSSGRFRMKAKSFNITNSRFNYTDENLSQPKVLAFTSLNGNLNDFYIKGADVTTKIEKLSFKDHRGLLVESLSADFAYSLTKISLEKLSIKTPKSALEGTAYLNYKRVDFKDFLNKVKFDVAIDKAHISANELNLFYNEFGAENVFYVATKIKGPLNNFKTKNLNLTDNFNSNIKGNIAFKNLFSTEDYEIAANFDELSSSYNQLIEILPKIIKKQLPSTIARLGEVSVIGDIKLSTTFLNVNCLAFTNLGEVQTSLELKNIQNIDQASYEGNVVLTEFNLGKLIDEKQFGVTTLNMDLNGKGFTKQFLDTKLKGAIQHIELDGYDYKNITVDGKMKMPYFNGYLNSNDPNLKMDFDGLVDLSKSRKQYNFKAQIDYVDLFAIKLSTVDTLSIFKGNVEFFATGNSFDDLDGELIVKDVLYQNTRDDYFFDDIKLTSHFDKDNVRTITVESPDIISGELIGKFKLDQLKKIAENAVGSLYANYSPNELDKNQFLEFDFTIYNTIIDIFIPEVVVGQNTRFKGKVDSDEGKFEFDFKSPYVSIFDNYLKNITIDIDNKNSLYNTYVALDSIKTKYYNVSDFNLLNITANDTLFVRSEFKGGAKNQDDFKLNLYHTIDKDKQSIVGFKKSDIRFKNYDWQINEHNLKNNKIVFDKKFKDFKFDAISLSHNEQEVLFNGVMRDSTFKDLSLNFKDVNLEKITPTIDGLVLNGDLNGAMNFKQNNKYYKPSVNLSVDAFTLNDFLLGVLNVNILGNDQFDVFDLEAVLEKEYAETFSIKGAIDITESEKPKLDLLANVTDFDIAPIGTFLEGIFSNMRGLASGKTVVKGDLFSPDIDGRLYLNEAGLTVPYLNVDYAFDKNSSIDLTEEQFIFRNVHLTDTKYKSEGYLNGSVSHKAMGDWAIDLSLISRNILALDKEDSEDTYYYGTAFLDGKAVIKGKTDALAINIEGKSEKNTNIKIPLSDVEEIGDNSFINYINFNKTRTSNTFDAKVDNGIDLNFYFEVNENAEVEIILDRATGHSMKGKGNGTITMLINTLGKFEMYGDFQVTQGQYNFRYGGLFDKKFNVKKYGTITWTGDPFQADLDLEAVYTTQANPGLLLESASFNRKVQTDVAIKLNGTLKEPIVDFTIDFPNVSSVLKNEIDYRLQNNDVRQAQAIGLLSVGSFITAENIGTTAYGPLFERAGSIVSSLFSGDDDKLKFGVDYSQGDRLNDTADRVGVSLNTKLNDKVSINGKAFVPVGGVNESSFVGNLEIQMQLDKVGNFSGHVFNRENNINYIGEGTGYTQGIGINYNVGFNTFRELMQKIMGTKPANNNSFPVDQIPDSGLPPSVIDQRNELDKKKEEETEQEKPVQVPEVE